MTSPSNITKTENFEKVICPPPVEKDKRHLIRQQLFFLFHAFRCTKISYTQSGGECKNQHCIMMRSVVEHIPQCNQGKECKFPHCPSSKEIIRHWKNCNDVECQVCAPLRKNNNRRNDTSNDNSKSNGTKDWKSILWKIRERILDKLTDDILPARVCEDVRNHSQYSFAYEYVKSIERDAFENSETIHLYICRLSEKFESVFMQFVTKKGVREQECVSDNIMDSKSRKKQFYNLIKDNIIKCYKLINGNFNDLFETIESIKEEKQEKMELQECNGSSESSLKTVSTDINEIKQEMDSPPHSTTVISPTKNIKSENICDTKMSPDSTSDRINKCMTESIIEKIRKYKTWTKEEICELFADLHQELCDEKDSEPFRLPVDWCLLGIPDYPDIIKNPMDLSTIKRKMDNGEYKDPWEVVDDYWLMLNNAWLYNKKTSKVYKMCNTLGRIFESKIDEIMTSCGYCCGRYYVYLPQVLICCTSNVCLIGRDVAYYAFQNDKSGTKIFEELLCERYICCEKCYNENPEEIPFLANETNNTICKVKKSLLIKSRNNIKENEEFINCKICNRKFHRICANHSDEIWREGYFCPACVKENTCIKIKENTFRASDLPHNKLSSHIENRINTYLRQQDTTINPVIIRVLSSSDKTVDVKPGMKAHYCDTLEMPESFNYRLKAIFAFQEIDGQEVCFFGFHAQEYGSDCPDPNSRRVYIAYLDSVYYFTPRRYRTDVYHEFLVGYLEYVKMMGFTMAHIWACPPGEGDDYIFHMHPPEQKLPKPKRLQEWYIKMLDKAMREGIVVDYKDIFSDALHSKMLSPTELPYFEGDYWPNALEDIFKEIEEEQNRRQKSYSDTQTTGENESGSGKEVISKNNLSKTDKKPKKRKLKKINTKINTNSKRKKNSVGSPSIVSDISRKVLELMEKRKENFFVIRLQAQMDQALLPKIVDKDPLIASDLMDGRDKFLCLARERHLEFSSLRRAKYSTLIFAYELHIEHHVYSCNVCGRNIDVRYTCRDCDDFELCETCYATESHPHPLHRIDADDVDQVMFGSMSTPSLPPTPNQKKKSTSQNNISFTNSNENNTNSISNNISNIKTEETTFTSPLPTTQTSQTLQQATQNSSTQSTNTTLTPTTSNNTANNNSNNQDLQDTTRAKMVRYSQSLQHACQCRDVNCRINFCNKMKTMVKHLQVCKENRSSCKLCCTFLRVCVVHAKFCNDPKCPVPQCLNYRSSWKQQGTQQRMQQAQMLRRRFALMQRSNSTQNDVNNTTNNGANTGAPVIQNNNANNNISGTNSSSVNNLQSAPQEEQIRSNLMGGKVPDPMNEEIIKQQQQQQQYLQQQQQMRMTYGGGKPMMNHQQGPHTIQYSASMNLPPQQVILDSSQHMLTAGNSSTMMYQQPGGIITHGMMNGGPPPTPQPMLPPQPQMQIGTNFTEDDIKIVREKYTNIVKIKQPEEIKRQQILDFVSTNPRYKAAFDFLLRSNKRPQPVPQSPSVMPNNGAPVAVDMYHTHHLPHHRTQMNPNPGPPPPNIYHHPQHQQMHHHQQMMHSNWGSTVVDPYNGGATPSQYHHPQFQHHYQRTQIHNPYARPPSNGKPSYYMNPPQSQSRYGPSPTQPMSSTMYRPGPPPPPQYVTQQQQQQVFLTPNNAPSNASVSSQELPPPSNVLPPPQPQQQQPQNSLQNPSPIPQSPQQNNS